jgi:ketosteroid isomerase-like protein
MATAGERFARALAAKDRAALCALLADPVDFQALTPGRHWQAATGRQVAGEIILGRWFGTGDHILELLSVTTGRVSEREHVAYRLRVRRSGHDYLVEQQAYYRTDGGRIAWMRVLCSGYQPV